MPVGGPFQPVARVSRFRSAESPPCTLRGVPLGAVTGIRGVATFAPMQFQP
jgi:hypothetical protein